MHSIELFFPENKEFLPYQKQYSSMFRKIYASAELMDDKTFRYECFSRYDLMDATVYESVKKQVKMKYSQKETSNKKKKQNIKDYNKQISLLNKSKLSNKRKAKLIFELNKKIERLKANIKKNSDIVFGSKVALRKVTYNKNMYDKTGDEKYKHQYIKFLNDYRENRILPYYSIGKSLKGGNRKFKFDFTNRIVIFKPRKEKHFIINIRPRKKQEKILLRLQYLINNNSIPITVHLTTNKIVIVYDNELLNGFELNKKECKAEQSKSGKEQNKDIWLKYKKEQNERKLEGKIKDRVSAIDMNPEYIGLTIRDKKEILFTKSYDLSGLVKNMKHNNTTEIKYNQSHIYKDIFKHLIHYKASYFVTEYLEFKHDQTHSTGMNRKTMMAWCRCFQKNIITRCCENTGIIHIQLNTAYSSFVGNLLYPYFDPISASVEIARRGLIYLKILTEDWYPAINKLRLDNLKLETYVPDLEKRGLTIPSLYAIFRSRNLRYRRLTKPQHKSKLIKYFAYW